MAKLTITTKRAEFLKTKLAVTIKLEYREDSIWKPVLGYPKEMNENPSVHTTFVIGQKHRVMAERLFPVWYFHWAIKNISSEWIYLGTPEEFGDMELTLDMRRKWYI